MKAQRRPDAATLNLIAPLLDDLRGLHGLEERRQGHFYFESRELIHFHQLPGKVVADVRFSNNFTRPGGSVLPYPLRAPLAPRLVTSRDFRSREYRDNVECILHSLEMQCPKGATLEEGLTATQTYLTD